MQSLAFPIVLYEREQPRQSKCMLYPPLELFLRFLSICTHVFAASHLFPFVLTNRDYVGVTEVASNTFTSIS